MLEAPVSGKPGNTRRTSWMEICKIIEGRDEPERLRVMEAVVLMSHGRIDHAGTFTSKEIVDNWLALTEHGGGELSHREFLRIFECLEATEGETGSENRS